MVVAGLGWFGVPAFHGFLNASHPVDADVLVVEGWVSDPGLERAVREARAGRYSYVVTAGGPLSSGSFLVTHGTYAALAAESLRRLGWPAQTLLVAPAAQTLRNRTYESAVAVRELLAKQGLRPRGINVVSEATHARRTWTVYRKVFAGGPAVGVVALPPVDYEAERWWRSSEGVKATLMEGMGWLYEVLWNGGR
jgi:hypothetical protein